MDLNLRAAELCERMMSDSHRLRIAVGQSPCRARLIDCGIRAEGGLEAGRRLAEVCLAGLGRVEFAPAAHEFDTGLAVMVTTDHPVAGCMASQYAGWRITGEEFFAMGSGPMRASAGKEALFDTIGNREQNNAAVGILEAAGLPPDEVCQDLAQQCGVAPENLTLLVAPTASLAGSVQVVARSVETALHKLFELEFDLRRIVSGSGVAPLPPASGNDLAAIGRTNDAILYGGEVMLWVRGDDASLEAIGPRVPSGASADYGQPFAAIFERYNRDFYRIDPYLFSPAVVSFANLDTGRTFRFGHTLPRVIHESFDIRQITA
ncbi:MAG: methenyltetrahydromethanopterin cyclohydrolase [Planctomycetia bacterium]|nr:methenyltetrahydromethanopterin cyclohydrolase [Planctomycetia bacterium]